MRRSFNLADLMLLVAAVAAGIALHRWVDTPIDKGYRLQLTQHSSGYGWTYLPAVNWFDYLWVRTPSYYVLVLTATLMVARWLSPRPSTQRIIRQPGAVACLAVVGAFLYGLGLHYLGKSLEVRGPHEIPMLQGHLAAWDAAVRWASPAVIGAWAALGWSGLWRAERSWIDRLGRVVGIYWLMYAPLSDFGWLFFEWLIPIPTQSDWAP